MAYGLKNISPLDLRPSTAIGVAIPFSAPNVFMSVYTTKDQLRFNIMNYMLTDPRERIFNPAFGSGLRSRLFEQIDQYSFEEIQAGLKTQLENVFPQITIRELTITGEPDYNSLSIKFSYTLNRTNENDFINVLVQN